MSRKRDSGTRDVTKGVNLVVAVTGVLTALLALLNDVLVPSGVLALGVSAVALLALGATLLPETRFSGFHRGARARLHGYWGRPIRTALVLSAGLSAGAYGLSSTAPGGWLGAHVPAIHEIQVDAGIVSPLATQLAAIESAIAGVKHETSEDPRKELANLGVPWTAEAFVGALKLGDERTVRLFLDGGMSPTADYKGAAAVAFILQPGLTISAVPMLTLLVEKGFDLDTILTDNYILPNPDDPNSLFPPQFENQDPYLYVGKGHFQGPALLWVVMVATWYGPTAHDLETLHFLLDHGADRTIAMNYMNFIAAWNDTEPYFTVLDLLKS